MAEKKTDYTEINLETLKMFEDAGEMNVIDDADVTEDMKQILEDAETYWSNLQNFRDRRERNREYYRGRQYSDLVDDPDNEGSSVSEEELIKRAGRQPLVNNQVRQLVKNLIGQYRMNDYKPMVRARKREDSSKTEMMTNALQYCYDMNELTELDARAFEEFLLSGSVIWKTGFDYFREKDMEDVSVEMVNPSRLFFNTDVSDVRLKDVRFIGEIIDTTLEQVIKAFAKNPGDEEKIKMIYANDDYNRADYTGDFDSDNVDNTSFYVSETMDQVRLFEVWRTEMEDRVMCHDLLTGEYYQHPIDIVDVAVSVVEEENVKRIEEAQAQGVEIELIPLIQYEIRKEEVWKYYFISPYGDLLASGNTPFEHQQFPYTMGLYPMVDSEVFGFVEDIIDQQRHINRIISLMDFMLGASAKGVLMIPEESIPDGLTPQDFADQWVKANGIIVYKGKSGVAPQQVVSNSSTTTGTQLLGLQMQLIKEISGVTEAIQGQTPGSGTPASLYQQMTTNATISSRDFFEFFFGIRRKRDFKMVQNIKQFYDAPRYVNVSGKDYDNEAYMYDPTQVQDCKFDIVIAKSANAPVFRQMIDDYLFQFLQGGIIDINMFLENTSMPFADKLLEQIKQKQETLQQTMQGGQPPTPEAMQMLQQAMGGAQK